MAGGRGGRGGGRKPATPSTTSSSSSSSRQTDERRNGSAEQSRAPCFSASATAPMAGGGGGGGGRGGGRKPATPSTSSSSSSSSSSRQRKPRASRESGPESSLESQKEGPSSSSPSVSSKKSQMVTPVLPKSLDSPVQPRKPLDSPLMMAEQVQPPKSQDSLVQTVASIQLSKPLDSSSASCGSRTVGSLDSPVQPLKSLVSPLMMAEQVQPPKSQDSLVQMVASIQLSKPLDSSSASTGSGAVGSDLGAAPFDICMSNSKGLFKLNPPLHKTNKENRLRAKGLSNSAAPLQHLGPGMVLLKHYLTQADQVKIIKLCRDLGVGPGGFYQPAYKEGARLSLRMMCLGKNWDPDSSEYGDIRHCDGTQPPKIPEELTTLVKEAIVKSHEFLKEGGASNPSSELPLMSPDICIVNFYTTTGKLGLHQDKDETKSSLDRRLPVVSFSLGDTAEFLYSNVRDEAKASKINLESGDVLIFGGESRHIFHGVSSIAPKTAPTWVTNEANLRAGRLNLTFRQYEWPGASG